MNPQIKDRLIKLTTAAKAVIYEPDRMREFVRLLGTKEGALMAVRTVLSAIETRIPVEPAVKPLLGVNVYMLLVDVAQEAMQLEPSPEIIKEVVDMLLRDLSADAQQPQGMLGAV